MELPRSADDCLRRYVALKSSLSSPRALDPPESVRWAKRCTAWPQCKSKAARWVWNEKSCRSDLRCVRCSRHWHGAYIAASCERQSPGDARAEALARLATYEQFLRDLGVWEGRAWGLYVLGTYGGFRGVADEARRRWGKEAPFHWDYNRVWLLVATARRTVEDAIGDAAGLPVRRSRIA